MQTMLTYLQLVKFAVKNIVFSLHTLNIFQDVSTRSILSTYRKLIIIFNTAGTPQK